MSRSSWKGPYITKSFFKKGLKLKINKDIKYNLKTWSRRSTILSYLIGARVSVHNGKQFIEIRINEEMLGHKLGEFVPTRKKFFYKKKK